MKKNVIALAVLAAMAAPLAAQAEVTVSGQLQVEVTSLSADDEMKAIGVTEGLFMHDAQEGGIPGKGTYSAIAFSASEDLGNGMKAIAKYAIDPVVDADGSAQGKIKNRDAYVGLSGGFGTVLLGRMSTPYKTSTVKWDPFLTTAGQARGNFGASGLHNGYADNVIAYANKFGTAKVVLGIALDESDDNDKSATNPTGADGETDGDHTTTASLNMPIGPVELALGYINIDSVDDGDATKVGVKYAAGPIGVSFQYETLGAGAMVASKDDLSAAIEKLDPTLTVAADGETFMLVSGTYTMGANTFALSYGQNSQDYVVNGSSESIDNTHLTAGVVHSFSKNTSVHLAYTSAEVDGDFGASGIAAGMRVKF